MSDFESTSVETSEVAEPTNETGVEDQEFAEPESEATETEENEDVEPEESEGKSDADAAFARMRRENEQYLAELEAAREELDELREANAKTEARNEAISKLTGNENGEIAALAEVTGMSEEEIIAEMEAAQESAQKDLKIQQLEERVNSVEAERLMQADLATLQKIDPTLTSLESLGDDYIQYVSAGLEPEAAYWAIKAKETANRATPPKEVGKVSTGPADKDYFTEAEIDAMSPEQQRKHYKKIIASWERNSG